MPAALRSSLHRPKRGSPLPSLSETLRKLQHLGDRLPLGGIAPGPGRLAPLEAFGRNPGNLRGWVHVPADLPAGAPLVVVLHGCTQTAAAYDHGSGWSTLADRFGFAVLYPEQQRANNANGCFNWFAPADLRRGSGEPESIREMIAATMDRHGIDPSRVFVAGLSAGGAMTAVMLATYPELFKGGAIIAGLPYGTAVGVAEALERMNGRGHHPATLSAKVRDASPDRRTWPSVSVWHGTADATVDPINAAMIVDQWRGLHGVGAPAATERVGGHLHRIWRDEAGRVAVEEYAVAGLGHGTPIATSGDEACGVPGPYMLDAGVSSTYRIAASWGLVPATAPAALSPPAGAPTPEAARRDTALGASLDPARAIADALHAAGLLKR